MKTDLKSGNAISVSDTALLYVLTLLSIAVFLLENWRLTEQIDDAYISFQYARNLVAGHGLVFNIGEPVEGYTNLSWTLLIALGMRLGFDAPMVCHVLSLFSGAILLALTARYTMLLVPSERRWVAGLAPWLLMAANSFVGWTGAGLETLLFAALITAAFCSLLKDELYWAVFWCALATITRPEGVLYSAVILGCDWLVKSWPHGVLRPYRLLKMTGPALIYLLCLLSYTAWRVHYYSEYLPNTFYAKAGGIPLANGVKYVWNFVIDGSGFLLVPAFVGAVMQKSYRIAFTAVVMTLFYVIAIGGDAFHLSRFLLPVLPLIIGGALTAIGVFFNINVWYGASLATILPLSVGWSLWGPPFAPEYTVTRQNFPAMTKRVSAQNHAAFGGVAAAQKLSSDISSISPPVKMVATIAIGQVAFFSNDIYVLDLVGLVDKHIARSKKHVEGGGVLMLPGHQRTDSDYVLDRRPDVIVIPKKGTPLPFNLPAIFDLWQNQRLEQLYEWDNKKQFYVLKSQRAG